jgi:hypothetical protein
MKWDEYPDLTPISFIVQSEDRSRRTSLLASRRVSSDLDVQPLRRRIGRHFVSTDR